jgi:hypothetical protein
LFVPAENYIVRATNESSEARRYIDEEHFRAYLKDMKDRNEKVSAFLPHLSTHFHPQIGSMVGDMVTITLKNLLLTF